jgi:hypothetical protein
MMKIIVVIFKLNILRILCNEKYKYPEPAGV